MDKEHVVPIYNRVLYSAIKNKKSEIMPFAATCLDLEIILSEVSQRERQVSYDITYNDTNEPIYGTETDSQIQKTNLRLPKRREVRKGRIRNLGLADANYHTENRQTTLYSIPRVKPQ